MSYEEFAAKCEKVLGMLTSEDLIAVEIWHELNTVKIAYGGWDAIVDLGVVEFSVGCPTFETYVEDECVYINCFDGHIDALATITIKNPAFLVGISVDGSEILWRDGE